MHLITFLIHNVIALPPSLSASLISITTLVSFRITLLPPVILCLPVHLFVIAALSSYYITPFFEYIHCHEPFERSM